MSERVMAGIVSCRPRPPWGRICQMAQQGSPVDKLCLDFNVTRRDLERELKARSTPAATPSPSPAAPKTPPLKAAALAASTSATDGVTRRRRTPSNKRTPVCSEDEVRLLLRDDRISWNEAAWLRCSSVAAMRELAAANDWSASIRVRRRASSVETALLARVRQGQLNAVDVALQLGVPLAVVERRVRRA